MFGRDDYWALFGWEGLGGVLVLVLDSGLASELGLELDETVKWT